MKLEIFKKALYYYESGMVFLEKETPRAMYFEVDGVKVTFSYGRGYLEVNCLCDYCCQKPIHKVKQEGTNIIQYISQLLCARKLACIFYMKHYVYKKVQKKAS